MEQFGEVHSRESKSHLFSGFLALAVDACTVMAGLKAALHIRFHSGWFAVDPFKGIPTAEEQWRLIYVAGIAFLITFRVLGLYTRPYRGRFEDQIPRMVRGMLLGIMVYFSAQAALQLRPEFSRLALGIAAFTVTGCFLAGRYILYRIEWNLARHLPKLHRVLLYGDNEVSRRLLDDVRKEPFLRSEVVGIVCTRSDVPDSQRVGGMPLYTPEEADSLIEQDAFTQVIVTDLDIGRERLVDLIARCEDRFVQFRMVPDVFHTLTSGPEILWIGGTPVLGTRRWPLDHAGKRIMKRASDILGAIVGLVLSGPIILIAGWITNLTSPGPMFYRQERCGENGRVFGLIKIRTMRQDAEASGMPGWTVPNDPRRTPVGAFLRRTNIDELPQLWNVLIGDMSLVGPRPERPYFVGQFKEEFDRYMHRHVYKPGITGWAQVHGLRGDTSISERLKYDLYYLENWSLSLDFKILIKTFFSHKNAY